jgi:hypothetical protein
MERLRHGKEREVLFMTEYYALFVAAADDDNGGGGLLIVLQYFDMKMALKAV